MEQPGEKKSLLASQKKGRDEKRPGEGLKE